MRGIEVKEFPLGYPSEDGPLVHMVPDNKFHPILELYRWLHPDKYPKYQKQLADYKPWLGPAGKTCEPGFFLRIT